MAWILRQSTPLEYINAVGGGGNNLHYHKSNSSLFLNTGGFISCIVDQGRNKSEPSSAMTQFKFQKVTETVCESSIITWFAGSGHFISHWIHSIVWVIKYKAPLFEVILQPATVGCVRQLTWNVAHDSSFSDTVGVLRNLWNRYVLVSTACVSRYSLLADC